MNAVPFQVMPGLTPEEMEALRADIAERGVIVPVLVDQHGRVLDGHHRRQIAAELGIDCPTEIRVVDSDEAAREIALTLNLSRRHLSREQRRQLIAAEIAARPNDSDRAIARRFGCSPSTVGAVRRPVSKLDSEDVPAAAAEIEEEETAIAAAVASLHEAVRGHLRGGAPAGVILAELTRFLYEGVPDPVRRSWVADAWTPLFADLGGLAWAGAIGAQE